MQEKTYWKVTLEQRRPYPEMQTMSKLRIEPCIGGRFVEPMVRRGIDLPIQHWLCVVPVSALVLFVLVSLSCPSAFLLFNLSAGNAEP